MSCYDTAGKENKMENQEEEEEGTLVSKETCEKQVVCRWIDIGSFKTVEKHVLFQFFTRCLLLPMKSARIATFSAPNVSILPNFVNLH